MLNRDRPVGQRIGDGSFLGAPPGTYLVTKRYPFGSYFYAHLHNERAGPDADAIIKIISFGWNDRVGQPHGRTGDKLQRKAAAGTIGLRNRGPYAAWHLKVK
jgi:hypothetical protein